MTRYQIIIQKKFEAEYWVNDYYLTATDFVEAESKAQPIVDAERAVTLTGVTFTNYRISTVQPNDGRFKNFPLNFQGQSTLSGEPLTLFTVARADFPAVEGRAGRKYLRGVLTEGAVTFNLLNPDTISAIDTAYCTPLRALNYLEKKSGVLLSDCVVNPYVGMRQLRKGTKRRLRTVIPL